MFESTVERKKYVCSQGNPVSFERQKRTENSISPEKHN